MGELGTAAAMRGVGIGCGLGCEVIHGCVCAIYSE